MKIAIVTDSNSGITQKQAQELGVFVLAMPFQIDGETYYEDITLTQEEFYKKLREGGNISTSQPSPGSVTDLWDKILQEYDQIVHIPMSSGLSGSCQTAIMLAQEEEYDGKVYVVNNQRISVTQRQSVIDAKSMAEAGYDAAAIQKRLEETKFDSTIYITLDTLHYLKKGGRLSATSAIVGGVLGITPVISVVDGSVEVLAKTRGHKKSIKFMVDYMKENQPDYNYAADFAYTRIIKNLDSFKESCKPEFQFSEESTREIGAAIGTHIGPGAFGVAYISK